MPLVRVEVRNEYGLGMPELYTETNAEDPKAVLDGVAVAGLVGILRQLGDLAEFAAEVFHGLQEQVLITSSRSHKLVERVHSIEAALPPLEKAILAQRSHLHFAYTAGCHWHARLKIEHNHFIYSDLPRCIMDSYEDCRDPPRLHKLDKFDIGGPGSCFKRYSDPTYFKRASAGTYETHLQGVPREKKARRSKKKRSSSRYRDMKHEAPTFTDGGRMDFASSNFKGKTSPFQDVSSIHVAPKPRIEPEMEDHFTSCDPRTESGYIECIFRPSFSTHSDDNESKELSSDSKVHRNTYLESTSLDENRVPDENSHSEPRSSYVTWDEKLEIIDSMGQPNDATEIQHKLDQLDNKEKEDFDSGVVDHVDFDYSDEHEPLATSIGVRNQPDEIESETDFYMDALNTIESESEADVDCQTKRELKQFPHVNKNVEGKQEASHLDDSSMNFESRVPEHTSLSKAMSGQSPNSIPKSHTEACSFSNNETSEMVGISSISLTSPDNFRSEKVEILAANSEIVASNGEPNSEAPSSDHISSTYESPNPPLPASGANNTLNQPFMFWTNGGLLGLEPSKPPDFGLPTADAPDSNKDDMIQPTSQNNTVEGNGHLAQEHDSNASSTMTSVINASNENNIGSSRIFEFSNRLLVNGFRKQITLVGDEKLASSVRSDVPEKTRAKPFREQFGSGSPLMSPSSSPPLELMRISFQPINGFETSKLKLKLPNGDMFPSFQLVPEHAISLHESGSDSEDDTFCRSSPYASDDCPSHGGSESNSDQWDSGDSPRSKDHELDDAFTRISSAESVSRFQQGFTDFDIPNLDSLNASVNHVIGENGGNYLLESRFPEEPTPPPPPLPPLEWRGIKPHPDVTIEKEDDLSEALTYALNLTLPEAMVPQQPKPAPLKQDHFVETVNHMPTCKQPDWKDRRLKNESNRTINGKVIEEKEDFLQQIRAKSFNLRRTSTTRPTTMPDGPPNVKVTAILEKANAIRQAVGSDDGDDDNWSDT